MENNLENLETVYTEETAVNEAELDGAVMDNVTEEAIAPEKKKPVGGIVMGIINAIFTVLSAVVLGFVISLLVSGYKIVLDPNPGWDGLGLLVVVPFSMIGIGIMLAILVICAIFFVIARFNRSKFFKISTVFTLAYNILAPVLSIIAFSIMILINRGG